MHIDIKGLKGLIKECMEELNEGCGDQMGPGREQWGQGYSAQMQEIPDEDMARGMWKSFVDEALGPDDRFRRHYVLKALGDHPRILETFFDGVAEDSELQEELYKAIDAIRKNK